MRLLPDLRTTTHGVGLKVVENLFTLSCLNQHFIPHVYIGVSGPSPLICLHFRQSFQFGVFIPHVQVITILQRKIRKFSSELSVGFYSAGLLPVVLRGRPRYFATYVRSYFFQFRHAAWAMRTRFMMDAFCRSTSPLACAHLAVTRRC